MSSSTIGLSNELRTYMLDVSFRDDDILRQLREETLTLKEAQMQISPEQGALLSMLTKILNAKKLRLDELKKNASLDEIKQKATSLENKPSSFRDSLLSSNQSIIAEIKQASPSAGIIDNNFDPERQAIHYENIGATAISVLTEEDFFLGSAEHLQKVKQKSSLPILRKDFIIHEYQIYEARILDADCILLIASILNDEQISHFIDVARSLNLD